jgi:hypothetical protein
LSFHIVDVSRLKHRINDSRIFWILPINIDCWIDYTKIWNDLSKCDLNDELTRDLVLDFESHRHLSQNEMSVDEIERVIVLRIDHFQNSRSIVEVVQSLDDQRKETLNWFTFSMTSVLILRFSNSFITIANQSRFSFDVELRLLRTQKNDDIVFRIRMHIYTKNEIIQWLKCLSICEKDERHDDCMWEWKKFLENDTKNEEKCDRLPRSK